MQTSISDYYDYKNLCKLASIDNSIFSSFRSHKDYVGILEHVSYESGLEYYDHSIRMNNKEFTKDVVDKLKLLDFFGNPIRYNYDKIGEISPTVLRYFSVLGDIDRMYGNLDNKIIVEIGAGYGGQSMLINLFHNIEKYIIIDLPEVVELIKKFLYLNNIDMDKYIFYSYPDVPVINSDFLISNYAFSECYKNIQDLYIKNLINNSSSFYMIVNFINQEVYSKDDLLTKINGDIVVYPENPNTSKGNLLFYKRGAN